MSLRTRISRLARLVRLDDGEDGRPRIDFADPEVSDWVAETVAEAFGRDAPEASAAFCRRLSPEERKRLFARTMDAWAAKQTVDAKAATGKDKIQGA